MRFPMTTPRSAAKPPSDFVGTPSGGGSSTLKVVLGVGCGVCALVVVVLVGFGAFGGIKCAGAFSEVADAVKGAISSYTTATTFVSAVQQEDYSGARATLSPEAQKVVSEAQLREAFGAAAPTLRGATCGIQTTDAVVLPKDEFKPKFGDAVGIEASAETQSIDAVLVRGPGKMDVVVSMRVRMLPKGEDDSEQRSVIDTVYVGQRPYFGGQDPAARFTHQLAQQLKVGVAYFALQQQAFSMMADRFPDAQALQDFVETEEPLIKRGTMAIEHLDHIAPGKAMVDVVWRSMPEQRFARLILKQDGVCGTTWKVETLKMSDTSFAPAKPDVAPQAASGCEVSIAIQPDGNGLSVQGKALGEGETLEGALKALNCEGERRATLSSSKGTDHGRVVEVLDTLRKAGIDKIAIETADAP